MEIESFLQRADEVKARNRLLETVPGSGYHDSDKDAHGKLCAPHTRHLPGGCGEGQRPLPRVSDHLVAFLDRRVVRFFGADATKAHDALAGYHGEIGQLPPLSLTGTDRKLAIEIPEVSVQEDTLELPLDTWNDFLHALDTHGVGVSCATSGVIVSLTKSEPFDFAAGIPHEFAPPEPPAQARYYYELANDGVKAFCVLNARGPQSVRTVFADGTFVEWPSSWHGDTLKFHPPDGVDPYRGLMWGYDRRLQIGEACPRVEIERRALRLRTSIVKP